MIAIFPAIAAVAESRDVEELAILVRKYHAVGRPDAVRLDVEGVISSVGIPVGVTQMTDYGAIACRDSGGRFDVGFMLRDQNWGRCEKQFMLAHLLGHYLLDVQPQLARGEWRTSGFREHVCPLTRYGQDATSAQTPEKEQQREMLADEFAGALLMPKAMVMRAMERLQDVKVVAEFFDVTVACLTRRLEILMGVRQNAQTPSFTHAESMMGQAEVVSDPHKEHLVDDLAGRLKTPKGASTGVGAVSQKQVSQEYTAVSAKTTSQAKRSHLGSTGKETPPTQSDPERALSRIRALAKRIDGTVR